MSAYAGLGVEPVINACGVYTDLGGSTLSPSTWAALAEVNREWASVTELLDASGRRIAELVGAPAARVAPGASACIALGVAACIARGDGRINEELPRGTGGPRTVVMQRAHRYKYARCALLAGAAIDEVEREDLAVALGNAPAAVLHPAHLDGAGGAVPLVEVSRLARAQGVPVIVDAAYLSFPVELLGSFTAAGADLVCFSAKYFYGPNAGGFIAGETDLVDAVAEVDFTRYEGGPWLNFGRPFKLDRTTIVATVLALEEWLAMDHDARWNGYARRVEAMRGGLGEAGVKTRALQFTLDERLIADAPNALVVDAGEDRARIIEERLAAGSPRILCVREGGQLVVCVETIPAERDAAVVRRLEEELEASR